MAKRGGYPYEPDYVVAPGEILEDYLNGRYVSRNELARRSGMSLELIEGLLSGQATLDADIAGKLEEIFDLKAAIWLRMEDSYRQGLKEGKKVPHFDRVSHFDKETVS